jgi:glutaredoxin
VITFTIYSRPGCHLCEEMKAVLGRMARTHAIAVAEVDISEDADLEARYGVEIPVLLLDGRVVAKYRVTEEALARMIRSRSG